jgi:propanol-preferring alcohol dehydrogenase
MILDAIATLTPSSTPLRLVDMVRPEPQAAQVRIRISACGVCHTELDEIEGRTAPPTLPIVLGHEVVGCVEKRGPAARRHAIGARVGVGWIHHSSGLPDENLSPQFRATGRDVNGGYAEFMTVDENYAYRIPDRYSDTEAAPLLCAGAVGYRALRLTGISDGQTLGLTGFGGSAHIVLQLAKSCFPNSPVYVFARDAGARAHADALGADWVGATEAAPPRALDAIIDTTPAWKPVVEALARLKPAGRLVINAIRKEDADKTCLLELRYDKHLWQEKELKSVANVTRFDIDRFLQIAATVPLKPEVETYPLEDANAALCDLKFSPVRGAKVLQLLDS